MSAISKEVLDYWLAAERDWITFDILVTNTRTPADKPCFFAQQYVEKLLKAALTQLRAAHSLP